MAKQQIVTMTDDLDPSQAAEATISFGIDGASYEIDLSKENADSLGSVLAPFIGAARRAGGGRSRSGQASSSAFGARQADSSQVRAWARSQGIEMSSRGRIPADVQAKYEPAH